MKVNSRITVSVTTVFLMQSVLMPWSAQAQYTVSPFAVPSYNTSTNAELNKLDAWKGLSDSLTSGTKSLARDTKKGKSAVCKKCEAPKASMAPDCGAFGAKKAQAQCGDDAECYIPTSSQMTKFEASKKEWEQQYQCLQKKKDCGDPKLDELNDELAALRNEVAEFDKMTDGVDSAITQAFDKNAADFNSYVGNLKTAENQKIEIEKKLGDDKSGLVAMNRNMMESLAAFNARKADNQGKLDMIVNEEKENEQFLEASKTDKIKSCLQYEPTPVGGKQLTCFKPEMQAGKDGQPMPVLNPNGVVRKREMVCSPMEFIESQVAQSAFVNKGQGVMVNDRNKTRATQQVMEFQGIKSRMMTLMGGSESDGGSGTKYAPASLAGWSDIQTRFGTDLQSLQSKTGINITSMLQASYNTCVREGNRIRNNLIRADNATSPYIRKKTEMAGKRRTLDAEVSKDLVAIKQSFTEVVRELSQGRVHAPLTLQQCPVNDSKKMLSSSCMGSIQDNLQKIQEGSLADTAFEFPGPPGGNLKVNCRGLNSCITELTRVKSEQENKIGQFRNNITQQVNEANKNINQAMQAYKDQLKIKQNAISDRFSKRISKLLDELKISHKDKLNFLENNDKLEQIENEGIKGPFGKPKDIRSFFGLLNTQDLGLADITEQLKDKQAKADEKNEKEIADAKEAMEKYASLKTSCNARDPGTKVDNKLKDEVGKMHTSCKDSTCTNYLNACEAKAATPAAAAAADKASIDALIASMKALQSASSNEVLRKWDKIEASLNNSSNFTVADCKEIATKCNSCKDNAKTVADEAEKVLNDATNAGK